MFDRNRNLGIGDNEGIALVQVQESSLVRHRVRRGHAPRALARCSLPLVQTGPKDAPRGQGERIFQGGPFRPVHEVRSEAPSWFLLEL
jgi:hypothetical protein